MRKFLTIAAASAALTAAAATPAAAIDFDGTFEVTDYNTDSGLIINVNPVTGPFHVELNSLGDTDFESLFTISTPEGDVGADDLVHQPIEVTFNFTNPTGFGGTVGGETWGSYTGSWIFNFQEGHVDWANPSYFNFGNGGKIKVSLSDTTFDSGIYGLYGKSANVKAKFTLEALPSAVPEPATWAMMITGFGLAGVALRRRRSLGAVAA